jgi:hypothetical protein
MTTPTPPEPSATPESVTAAVSDLERLQELLQRAGQSQADLGEVTQALSGYWRDHSRSVAAVAAGLGEEVRRQMLAELYTWRARLAQQLENSSAPVPPLSDRPSGDSSPPGEPASR